MTKEENSNPKAKRNYILSLRKTDSENFKIFLDNQSNFNETMRYLIYKHIVEQGTDDISKAIYEVSFDQK